MARHPLLTVVLVVVGFSAPQITSVEPAAPAPSPRAQTLTITGEDFLPGLTLTVSEPAGNTVVVRGDGIRNRTNRSFEASVLLSLAGTYTLVVTNTDGGTSPPFALPVKPRPAADGPVIERLTPEDPSKRPDEQTLLVEGQRFSSGLNATVTDPMGADVPGVRVSKVTPNSFELTVKLEHSGEYTLVVTNPSGAVASPRRFFVR